MTNTETKVTNLKINRLTKSQYEEQTTIGNNELTLVDPEFTGGKVLITDTNGDIVESTTTSSELGQKIGYTLNSASVVGTTKNVAKTSPECLYVPNGLIMGGSAAAAGLVTRGVCGVNQPGDTGACTKDNLYINYDSDNNWNPNGRGLVINAGSVGTNLGQNMYQYCAVRGDIVKAWVEGNVYDGVDSTSTTQPLSANMGKELQDQVNNLKNIGRFLALWNCSTGLAQSNPTTSPYTYKTGDYFIIGTISSASPAVNYKPDGTTYTIGTASTVVETGTVEVGYIYWYDGSNWTLMQAEAGTVTDVQVNGTSVTTNGVGNVPLGSDSTFGAVKVDNSSIIASSGVITANKATGNYSTTFVGNPATTTSALNVGANSTAHGWYATALGCDAVVGDKTNDVRIAGAIQLGRGSNQEAGSFYVGLSSNGSTWNNYKLLDSSGIIPNDRINYNQTIAITYTDGTTASLAITGTLS